MDDGFMQMHFALTGERLEIIDNNIAVCVEICSADVS